MSEILELGEGVISKAKSLRAQLWSRKKKCRECGTKFRYHIWDLRDESSYHCAFFMMTIHCPNCNKPHVAWCPRWITKLVHDHYHGDGAYRWKCTNCGLPPLDHVNDKCPFAPTTFSLARLNWSLRNE